MNLNPPIGLEQDQVSGQVFGIPPPQTAPMFQGIPFVSNMFNSLQQLGPAVPVADGTYFPMQHTPLGSLAAFKGDLLFPIANIGFSIVAVALVVKFFFFLFTWFKTKVLVKLLALPFLKHLGALAAGGKLAALAGGKLVPAGLLGGLGTLTALLDGDDDDKEVTRKRKRRSPLTPQDHQEEMKEQLDRLASVVKAALDSQPSMIE